MAKRKTKKRKRGGRKSKSLNRSVLPVLSIGALGLIAAAYYFFTVYQANKVELKYAQRWEIADRQFSRRALEQAKKEYRAVAADESIDGKLTGAETFKKLAEEMIVVCEAIDNNDLSQITESVQSIESTPETLDFAADDQDILSRQDRLDEINRWATDEIRSALSQLQQNTQVNPPRTLSDAKQFVSAWDATTVEASRQKVDRWIPYAGTFGESAAILRQAIGDAAIAERFRTSLNKTVESADKAIASLKMEDLTKASFQWESTKTEFPSLVADDFWTDYQKKLRGSVRNQFSGGSNSGGNQPTTQSSIPAGVVSKDKPASIPLGMILALPDTQIRRNELPDDLIFVRVHQHCYAIDPRDGQTHWVVRVGYDSKWLPETTNLAQEKLVHCVSTRKGQETVHVMGLSGVVRWSMKLPNTTSLAGPPVAANKRLHLLLKAGEMWTLNLADGSMISRMPLPESTSSPLVVREDKKGVMIIGDKLGVYLVDISGEPKVEDVVFPDQNANTMSSCGMWIPPFAVVFQNELTETCHIKVFRQKDSEYQKVQESSLRGRLWDSPAVVGADFLVVTDAITESIQHVDVDKPINPVATRFERVTPSPYPRRPYFLSHPDAPFLSVRDHKVICYWIDPLAGSKERKPIVRWEHDFPTDKYVAIQPLSIRGDQVIVASQSPERRAVLVQALSLDKGDVKWSLDLGGEITSVRQSDKLAILRTDAGQLIRVRSEKIGLEFRLSLIDTPATGDEFDWIEQTGAVVRVAQNPLRLQVIDAKGKELSSIRIAHPAVSPIAVRVGEIRFGGSEPASRDGIWAAMIDSQNRLQVYPLKRDLDNAVSLQDIIYHQFKDISPDGWYRPIWLDERNLLLSHRDGLIFRAELRGDGGVLFVGVNPQHEIATEPFSGPVLAAGTTVWAAGTPNRLSQFSLTEFQEIRSVTLPAKPTTSPIRFVDPAAGNPIDGDIMLGLRNGSVVLVDAGKELRIRSVVPVSKSAITLVSNSNDGGWAIDEKGVVFRLSQPNADGSIKVKLFPGYEDWPTRVAPIRLMNKDYIATVNGVWAPLQSM